METEKSEEFYKRLEEQLVTNNSWPSDYLYKFIVPSDEDKIAEINQIFDNTGAVINSKQSKKGKYTSISIMVNLSGADKVIAYYKEVGKIKGVMSL